MDDGYTKREHDFIFNDIKDSLKRIETQTTTTNGKVANITAWREQVVGGIKVALIVVLPMLIWGFITLRNLPDTIRTAVQNEISNKYEVQIVK